MMTWIVHFYFPLNVHFYFTIYTQVPEEGCDLGVYQVGKKYSDHPGILQSDDMTTESIVAKLMWILGQTYEQAKISQLYYKEINHDRV